MSPSRNRGRIELKPLGSDMRLNILKAIAPVPHGAVALADVIEPERGWLIEFTATGILAFWSMRRVLVNIDERKARAALDALS